MTPKTSQLNNPPKNDCGPACVLTLLERMRWADERVESVENWAKKIDPEDDGTTAPELAWMIRQFGVTPILAEAPPLPYIALVEYTALPLWNRLDKSGREFGHWILRINDNHYDDPYQPVGWTGKHATKEELDRAIQLGAQKYWNGQIQSIGIKEINDPPQLRETAREPYDRVYHVIPANATPEQAAQIFALAWANKQTVGGSYDDAGLGDGLNSKTAILHLIPETDRQRFTDFFTRWYPSVHVQFED